MWSDQIMAVGHLLNLYEPGVPTRPRRMLALVSRLCPAAEGAEMTRNEQYDVTLTSSPT